MIIKKLIMHNFGVYSSTNVLEFSSNKPVALIGGMNGRGKTTILEAVLLSLYGSNSFAYTESKFNTYGQYLKSYVNKANGTLETYLEIMLSSKQYCGISNGSACTSHDYSPSYVLTAMGLDADRISSAIRISWGADTDISQMRENLTSLFEVAKGLVF